MSGNGEKRDSRVVPKSIRVTREMAAYLADRGTGVIEDVLRRTKDFREWAADQN